MEFVYPNVSGKIYIPVDLDGNKGRAILEAIHRNAAATLYWHLDDEYLGTTKVFHKRALDIAAGPHVVTIVDADGNRLSRSFEVLPQTIH
jgi:penicillin-binding protein 1C